ncbi:MAG: DUF4352 domain-containing protein [Nitrospinota bacterium]|nr:DUF4352 domain-containing protein [Nitrospinota bacterium]MDH5678805.1 DUF4352 domain-containing protein [Nitrospinota bacterium]MDH5757022.1 DUF4352 domain-containing protein [Nitrospinota bacterium]
MNKLILPILLVSAITLSCSGGSGNESGIPVLMNGNIGDTLYNRYVMLKVHSAVFQESYIRKYDNKLMYPSKEGYIFIIIDIWMKSVDSTSGRAYAGDCKVYISEDNLIEPLLVSMIKDGFEPFSVDNGYENRGLLVYEVPQGFSGWMLKYKDIHDNSPLRVDLGM